MSGRGESDRETVGKKGNSREDIFFLRNRKWRIEGKAQDPGGTRDNTKDQEEPGRPQLSGQGKDRQQYSETLAGVEK